MEAKPAYPSTRRFPESALMPAQGDAVRLAISMVGPAAVVSPIGGPPLIAAQRYTVKAGKI